MLAFLLSTALTASWVTIPASTQIVRDPQTGINVTVTIDEFRMDKTETTQQLYQQVMHANPSQHKGPNLPVENVSWFDAIRFANALSLRDKLKPCYTLPAGTRNPECTG